MGGQHGGFRGADLNVTYDPLKGDRYTQFRLRFDALTGVFREAGREKELSRFLDPVDPADTFQTQFVKDFPALPSRYQVLAQLGMRMLDGVGELTPAEAPDVLRQPAGYTYLGQFIAHDLSYAHDAAGRLDDDDDYHRPRGSMRWAGLDLETIYGGGPRAFPMGYAELATNGASSRTERTRLRLGPMTAQPNTVEISRRDVDLPRTGCPHLLPKDGFEDSVHATRNAHGAELVQKLYDECRKLDQARSGELSAGARKELAALLLTHAPVAMAGAEVLIADPRNDSHALISQLTAIFHRLHNKSCELLADRHPGLETEAHAPELFARARAVTTYLYRSVVWNDYLRSILDPGVFDAYAPLGGDGQPIADRPVEFMVRPGAEPSVEFSFAAFRFGHAMIRDAYTFRHDSDTDFTISRIIEHSSGGRSHLVPADDSWIVDWLRFFPSGPIGPRPANGAGVFARAIAPSVIDIGNHVEAWFPPEGAGLRVGLDEGALSEEVRGLPYRDLVRQTSAPIATVDALVRAMQMHPALTSVLAGYPWLVDATERAALVRQFLDRGRIDFAGNASELSVNPPLSFFVLLEASERAVGASMPRHLGARLGPVGSFIVAETLFGKLATVNGPRNAQGRWPANYSSLVAASLSVDVDTVFGHGHPITMHNIIDFLR